MLGGLPVEAEEVCDACLRETMKGQDWMVETEIAGEGTHLDVASAGLGLSRDAVHHFE